MAQAERERPQNFIFSQRACEESQSGEDIELSLGLSLNGRFGVDPRAKKLCRTSSIPDFVSPAMENGAGFAIPFVSSSDLIRTSSLPTETDEMWRQRKEMQMLRRLEAKRKRPEKQRNLKALTEDRNHDLGEITSCEEINKEIGYRNSNGLFGAGAEGFSSKSTVTDPSWKCNSEARSPVSVQSLSECEHKFKPVKPNVAKEAPPKDILSDMPCVSTKGDGLNGRRIEGFLYRYKKGEEVRIVCVCHGSFLTPAEFVKHAGGGDVTHPLKHILVNPYPLL